MRVPPSRPARFCATQSKPTMAKAKTCLRCGSDNLERGTVQSTGKVYFRAANAKLLTLQTGNVSIVARICLDCGTLDLAGDAKKVRSLTGKAQTA
jgi:predicted nucleic-acid-binding Zn-ribbon protein